jgi:hypothetical protein
MFSLSIEIIDLREKIWKHLLAHISCAVIQYFVLVKYVLCRIER